MKICPKCFKFLNDSDKFCVKCGTDVQKREYCSNCGKEIINHKATSCPSCGCDRTALLLKEEHAKWSLRSSHKFGSYYGDISWTVIDGYQNSVLLLSDYIIECQPYNETTAEKVYESRITWENCTLRKWLNGKFYNSAFSAEEKKRINKSSEDYVFLLSDKEALKYLDYDWQRGASPTSHADSQRRTTEELRWWTRSIYSGWSVPTFTPEGMVEDKIASDKGAGVRPAIWLRIDWWNIVGKQSLVEEIDEEDLEVEEIDEEDLEVEEIDEEDLEVEEIDEEDLEVEEIDEEDLEVEEIDEEDLEVEEIDEEDLEVEEIDDEEPVSNVRSTKGDNTFEELKKGDIVHFGSYYQENDKEKTPIEWIVLRKKEDDNTLTLISKNVLDVVPFDITKKPVKWGSSTVRQWLNNEFLNTAFTKEEQAKIVEKEAQTKDNSQYGTEGEKPGPFDKICLFAEAGIKKHFPSNIDRMAKPTPYAKSKGVACDSTEGNCHWWTRTPGFNQQYACVVDMLGNLNMFGEPAFADFVGIRPFIWIKL